MLSPEHKRLIKILAAEAVEQYLADQHNLLQTQEKKSMEQTSGERPHAHRRTHPD